MNNFKILLHKVNTAAVGNKQVGLSDYETMAALFAAATCSFAFTKQTKLSDKDHLFH